MTTSFCQFRLFYLPVASLILRHYQPFHSHHEKSAVTLCDRASSRFGRVTSTDVAPSAHFTLSIRLTRSSIPHCRYHRLDRLHVQPLSFYVHYSFLRFSFTLAFLLKLTASRHLCPPPAPIMDAQRQQYYWNHYLLQQQQHQLASGTDATQYTPTTTYGPMGHSIRMHQQHQAQPYTPSPSTSPPSHTPPTSTTPAFPPPPPPPLPTASPATPQQKSFQHSPAHSAPPAPPPTVPKI